MLNPAIFKALFNKKEAKTQMCKCWGWGLRGDGWWNSRVFKNMSQVMLFKFIFFYNQCKPYPSIYNELCWNEKSSWTLCYNIIIILLAKILVCFTSKFRPVERLHACSSITEGRVLFYFFLNCIWHDQIMMKEMWKNYLCILTIICTI